mmetsp:Transcript_50144/g.116428  ORF Transcript_50144/g.116428 Transcript_50144/m.116428 type:complete len:209 (+) Transcript_50144:237-863(+)
MASIVFRMSRIFASSRHASPSCWRCCALAACSNLWRALASSDSAANMLSSARRSSCSLASFRALFCWICSSSASRRSLLGRLRTSLTLGAALDETTEANSCACSSLAWDVRMSRLCNAAMSERGAGGGFGAWVSVRLKLLSALRRLLLASICCCKNSAFSRNCACRSACARASMAAPRCTCPSSCARSRNASEARISKAVMWRCSASS